MTRRYLEDFSPGQKFGSGKLRVDPERIKSFAGEFDPRPRDFLNIRQMFHEVSFTRFSNLARNQVESWRVFTAPINYELNSGEEIEFNYAPQFERLFQPFEIAKVAK